MTNIILSFKIIIHKIIKSEISTLIAKTCPVCEEVFYKRFTHLPLYGLSEEQLTFMADAVLESVAEMQAGK